MVSSSLTVFIMATAVACIYGQTFKVTNSATDYYRLAQRDLLNDCDAAEVQIDVVNVRFADQLGVLQIQQGNVLDEIRNVNKTYTQLQALNLKKKYCIQKNVLQFITFDNANDRLDTCYLKASSVATDLTKTARYNLLLARNVVLTSLPNGIATCNSNNQANPAKLEECYVKEVTLATNNCNYYLDIVQTELDKSLYTASVAINTAVKCSFEVEQDVLKTMGKTQQVMRNCEETFDESNMRSTATEVQSVPVPVPATLKKLAGQ